MADGAAYYAKALALVDDALSREQGECREDLLKLKKDLLTMLNECEGNVCETDHDDCEMESSASQGNVSSTASQPLPGFKCSVYMQDPTIAQCTFKHNAIVYDRTGSQVLLLFVHPISVKMQTCKDFLSGRCERTDCRYNHGYRARLEELMDFNESDDGCYMAGSACLALESDTGLWLPADIQAVTSDGRCCVRFRNVNRCVELEPQDVFVTGQNTSTKEVLTVTDTSIKDGSFCRPSEHEFGAWERHTKAIGSKLLLKMGYKAGEGLGKRSDGLTEPLMPRRLKAKTSLDKALLRKKAVPEAEEPFAKINSLLAGVSAMPGIAQTDERPGSLNMQIVRLDSQIESLKRAALKTSQRNARRKLLHGQMLTLAQKRTKSIRQLYKQDCLKKLTRF